MGARIARSQGMQFDEFRPGCVEQGRADPPARERSPAAPRHRPPSARDARWGCPPRSAGTLPVLKSMTETLASSTSSRSTVPAITRPSGKVAASGASPSDPAPNKRGEARIGEDAADLIDDLAANRGVRDAGRTLEPAIGRAGRASRLDRRQALEQLVDPGPAQRCGAHRFARRRRALVVDGDRRRRERARRTRFGRSGCLRPVGNGNGAAGSTLVLARAASRTTVRSIAQSATCSSPGARDRRPSPARRSRASNWPAAGRRRPSSPSA